MKAIIEKIIDKLMSGRYSMLVLFGLTLCVIATISLYLLIKGRIEKETFMTIVAIVATNFTMMWKDYMQVNPKNGEKPPEVKP